MQATFAGQTPNVIPILPQLKIMKDERRLNHISRLTLDKVKDFFFFSFYIDNGFCYVIKVAENGTTVHFGTGLTKFLLCSQTKLLVTIHERIVPYQSFSILLAIHFLETLLLNKSR